MSTYVLVPGSWSGGWCWREVTSQLRARGHTVYEQTLTGMADRSHLAAPRVDLETHIADVANTVRYAETSVVLVGHSYAGFVVTGVADAHPESISHLVYLDANIPKTKRSSMFGDFAEVHRRSYMEQVRRLGEGWKLPNQEDEGPYSADLSRATLKRMNLLATPQPVRTYTQRVKLTGRYRSVPRTFIKCLWEGNPFDPDDMRRQGMNVMTIRSGHWPMLSSPSKLARLLDRCAVPPQSLLS